MAMTTTPITTDGWYRHTNGTYGFYSCAARAGGPMGGTPHEDWQCVSFADDGSLYAIGWPAREPLASELGLGDSRLLTLEGALVAYRAIASRRLSA